MTPFPKFQARNGSGGFALPTAIFLMVILAAVAAFLIGIRLLQDSSVSLDVLGARAYQAAKAGIQWGTYNSLINNTCGGSTALTFGGTLSSFGTTVTCSNGGTTHTEGTTTINIDTIISTACNQPPCPNAAPTGNYVERQLTTVVNR